jgi:hypothetical protein
VSLPNLLGSTSRVVRPACRFGRAFICTPTARPVPHGSEPVTNVYATVAEQCPFGQPKAMSNPDNFDAFVHVVTRLGQEFANRSTIEIATAVLDAADHARARARFDQGAVERSARHRLSAPTGDGLMPRRAGASRSSTLLSSRG